MSEVPEGWRIATIDKVAEVNPRLGKTDIPGNQPVTFVPMSCVGAGNGTIDLSNERPYSEVKKGFTPFAEGDVLFAKITPCMENGKMAVVPKLRNGHSFGSTEFHVLRPRSGIDARYLYYYISNKSFRADAQRHMTGGVGQKRVPTTYLKSCRIPVAPLEQQLRIVAEIEKQFSRLDEAVTNLKRINANLKRYKAAVLKAAVEGKLTEQWRKDHPNVEPADKLLDRILAVRRDTRNGKGKYKKPFALNDINTRRLPKTWRWASVDQLGNVQLGRQRSPQNRSKDYPVQYIRAANITERGLDLSDLLEMEFSPQEQERYKLRHGDLVLSEASGSPNQVGKPALWQGQLPMCCFQNTVIRLRPPIELSTYLLMCFKSYYVNGFFAKIAGGVGINHLSAGKFSKINVPLPPLPEQHQIMNEVERRFSVIEGLESVIDSNLNRKDRLHQSILGKAFDGKLIFVSK